MSYGYVGKILHVDLTSGSLEVETPPESFYRMYMGGSAMGLYYILKHTPPNADPLGPENVLTLFTGVTTGAAISGLSRINANAKSPMSGGIGDGQGGGFFPAELKFAGFDGIVVKGKSPKPVYLFIKDGSYELRDASHLIGKVTGEVDKILEELLSRRTKFVDANKRVRVVKMAARNGDGWDIVQIPVEVQINNEAGQSGAAIWKQRDKGRKLVLPYLCQRIDCWAEAKVGPDGKFLYAGYCSAEHAATDPYLGAQVPGVAMSRAVGM